MELADVGVIDAFCHRIPANAYAFTCCRACGMCAAVVIMAGCPGRVDAAAVREGETRGMGLAAGDADLVARLYGLGPAIGPMLPVARGELGRVWRLPTVGGVVAVKELFLPPTEGEAAADVDFQLGARRVGVLLPSPMRRTDGRVLAVLPSGVTVRVYEWMDLRPLDDPVLDAAGQHAEGAGDSRGARRRPDEHVGAVLARLHLMADLTAQRPHPWFVEPVGEPAWVALLEALDAAGAPFAADLAELVPELVRLEELLPCPLRGDERRCHLDLDDSNLAWDDRGRLVVLDWENSGPASPVSELAMVAAEYGPDRAIRLCGSYREAGGPAVIRTATDFATAVAVQGHLMEFYARRWLSAVDPDDRSRSDWRMGQHCEAPLTHARIADVLTAVLR
ncbi:MAG TPA: phosphotransferase [Mycobacteriales bacterium]